MRRKEKPSITLLSIDASTKREPQVAVTLLTSLVSMMHSYVTNPPMEFPTVWNAGMVTCRKVKTVSWRD